MKKIYIKKKNEKWPSYSEKQGRLVKNAILNSNLNYWTGKSTLQFENKFAKFMGIKYGIAVSNASNGLDIAIKCLNLKKNDEVIISPKSYYSSVTCIIKNDLKPVFIDLNLNSNCFDENQIEKKITKKTKLILCVHLGGFPCNMIKINKIAKKYNLFIIEDCSQAHGAKINKKFVGNFSDISVWSFCNDKIISTGEGGMICSNNRNYFKKLWFLKENGRDYDSVYYKKHKFGYKWIHEHVGYNFRMTEMQAILGMEQLKSLNKNIKYRNKLYENIIENFNETRSFKFQKIPNNYTCAFYRLYALVDETYLKDNWNRDKILMYLEKKNIDCNVGSCSELYREKGIKNYFKKNFYLHNARLSSDNSIAFILHHNLSREYIVYFNLVLNNLFKRISK